MANPKIKHMKEKKFTTSGVMFIVFSLALTVALFFGLIYVQNMLSEDIVYKEIVVAKQDIPEGLVLTEENIGTHLTTKQVNIMDLTTSTLYTTETLLGKQARVNLVAGESVMEKDFMDIDEFTKNFANPIEVSIDVSVLANADAGKLRQGDLVNIAMTRSIEEATVQGGSATVSTSLLDEETKDEEYMATAKNTWSVDWEKEFEAFYVMENAYVAKATDAAGLELAPTDVESNAGILVLVIDKSAELLLNEALANGENLRVSKILMANPEAQNKTDVSAGDISGGDVEISMDTDVLVEITSVVSEVEGSAVLKDSNGTDCLTITLAEDMEATLEETNADGIYSAVVNAVSTDRNVFWTLTNQAPNESVVIDLPENALGYTGAQFVENDSTVQICLEVVEGQWLYVGYAQYDGVEDKQAACTELLNYVTVIE